MPTIRLESNVKKELEDLMLKDIKKEITNPKNIIIALKNKYGYTHSEFIAKLIKIYKASR